MDKIIYIRRLLKDPLLPGIEPETSCDSSATHFTVKHLVCQRKELLGTRRLERKDKVGTIRSAAAVELLIKLVQQVLPEHAGLTESLKISRRVCGAYTSVSL